MSEALITATRAEASAAAAHHRLDKNNGSIDRLGREVGDLRLGLATTESRLVAAIEAVRVESSNNTKSIIARLDIQDGVEKGAAGVRRSLLDKNRWWITTAISILGSGLFVVLATYFLRS